jgi:predicted phosphodiesterase
VPQLAAVLFMTRDVSRCDSARPSAGSAIVSGQVRVAALYDIHGNLPALRAVLDDVAGEGVSAVVIGGDVATGPLPRDTIEHLVTLGERARFVRGNADRELVAAYDAGRCDIDAEDDPSVRASAFAASRISRDQRDFLASYAPRIALEVGGLGPTLFCHGSPRSDTEIITPATSKQRLREMLEGISQGVVVCGHTHRQFDRTIDSWRVVNAGSVGLPYEGRPGAHWALLGPEVELRRTDYDLEKAIRELQAGGFPDLKDMLRESLLEPMDPNQVSDLFERQALNTS